MIDLIVSQDETGLSLSAFLQRRAPTSPLGYLHQLLKKGRIGICRQDGSQQAAAGDEVLQSGDRVLLPGSRRLQDLLQQAGSPSDGVDILLETPLLLVVAKPAGLAVHAGVGHGEDNLADRVARLMKQRGERFSTAPIHRLDLETSGPILFGKGKRACGELGKLFMTGRVEKRYLALVRGNTPSEGELKSVIPAKGKLKEAACCFTTLKTTGRASLLDVVLQSGRQHQIRRQFADAGHPLFGDRRYRGPAHPLLKRLFLHCHRLGWDDPVTGERVSITLPLPPDLQAICEALGIG